MKQLTGTLIFSIFLFTRLCAQQYSFSTYLIEDGLSQSVVNCVFQDSKKFIWVGTQNGLDRFDGENFKHYRYNPTDSNSISNNWIYAISEDRHGDLWIGTKGGLHKFIRNEERFQRISYQTNQDYDVSTYIYDNLCLKNGNILINTPPVISIFNPANLQVEHYTSDFNHDASVKDVKIPVLEDKSGRIWIGNPNGLASFQTESKEFTYYRFKNRFDEEFSEANITALFQDRSETVWVGTDSGLYEVNETSNMAEEFEFVIDSDSSFYFETSIKHILQHKNGNLFLAAERNGLYLISENPENTYNIQNFIPANSQIGHDNVQALLIDGSENLWVGTLFGLSKTDLKKKKFELFRNTYRPDAVDLLGNVMAGLYQNDDGIIWAGNWGQGLNLVNPITKTVEHFSSQHSGNHYLPNDYVHVIFKDNKGNIWLGTRNGIFIYEKSNNRFTSWKTFFNQPDFPTFENTRILQIIQDNYENVWIASSNGLYKVNTGNSIVEVFNADQTDNKRLSANLVYSLLEDSEGLIWIATINGLDVYDPVKNEIKNFTKENDGLNSNFNISLCEDGGGNIWIGSNAYLNIFNKATSEFSYFGEEQGIPSNYIYDIQKDLNNNLWFATGYGLCKLDKSTDELEIYTQEDGLQSLEFNLRAACVCEDGQMLFGGMNGFNIFHPDSIEGNQYKPDMVFTSITKTTNGKQENINPEMTNKIVLKHDVQSFTIEFAALEFTNPEKNNYKYKMLGITDKWIEIGTRNFAPFFALPPGEYNFIVIGSNNDDEWNTSGISLQITILPPWWRSNFAYFSYVFVLILSIVAFVILRERKLKQDKIALEKKVTERTRQVKEQNKIITSKNEELEELNRTKDKFFSIIGHDLGNHFNIIIGFSEVLLSDFKKMDKDETEKHLKNIYKSSLQAHELLANLLTWSRLQRNAILFKPLDFNVNTEISKLIRFHEEAAMKKNILIDFFKVKEISVSSTLTHL